MKRKLLTFALLLVAVIACVAVANADYPVNEGQVVGFGELDQITEVGGHPVGTLIIEKKQTCTEKGIARFDCLTPEEHADTSAYHVVYIEADDHQWSSKSGDENWGKVVKEPTCTETGKAIDVCTVCKLENPDVYRVIAMTPHVYDNSKYHVAKEPSCTAVGYGIRYCINCGHENDDDVASYELTGTTEIVIDMIDHKWTEWSKKPSDCLNYGEARRYCVVCGAPQLLDKDHLTVVDHGKEISIDEVIPKLNNKWDVAVEALNEQEFDNETELNAALKKASVVEYVEKKNWLIDCYTREITLTCKYCNGTVHDDIVYNVIYPLTVAHKWVLQDVKEPATTLTKEEIEAEDFINDDGSLAPTCLLPGFDLYLCDKDAEHSHNPSSEYADDPAFKKVPVAALGHNFGEWEIVGDEMVRDGEVYVMRIRECDRCHATENEVVKLSEITKTEEPSEEPTADATEEPSEEPKEGIVVDEDGVIRYYVDGEVASDFTGIVRANGEKYAVVKGEATSNGFVSIDGSTYYVEDGIVAKTGDGLVKNPAGDDGYLYYYVNGRLRDDVSMLWSFEQGDGEIYYIQYGKVLKATGVLIYEDGHAYVLEDGVRSHITGTYTWNGKDVDVVDGVVY